MAVDSWSELVEVKILNGQWLIGVHAVLVTLSVVMGSSRTFGHTDEHWLWSCAYKLKAVIEHRVGHCSSIKFSRHWSGRSGRRQME